VVLYGSKTPDKVIKLGNTTIEFYSPDISEEENEKRWQEVNELASRIARNLTV
jgi:hypothetical protein